MGREGVFCVLAAITFLFQSMACGKSPEDARVTLGEMNIPYTSNAFLEAAKNGDDVVIKLFLDAGMKPNTQNKEGVTALMRAAFYGHTSTVQVLLDEGADINAKTKGPGATALMLAVILRHTEMVQFLLDKGADVNVKTKEGDTALKIAEDNNYTEIVTLLKQHGAKE